MLPKYYAPLPERTEWLLSEIVDSGLRIHKSLGPGLFEKIYRNAFCIELKSRGIPFETEKEYLIHYRDEPVGKQHMDLIVDECVIVEIKAVDALAKVHEQQICPIYGRQKFVRAC